MRRPSRMAGQALNIDLNKSADEVQADLKRLFGSKGSALTPWADEQLQDMSALRPGEQGSPNWHGRTEQEYAAHNRDLYREMSRRMRLPDGERAVHELLSRQGYSDNEIYDSIRDFRRGWDNRQMRQERFSLPQTAADEAVAMDALRAVGVDDVHLLNVGDDKDVDIQGMINGNVVNIDAQQRISRDGDLNLSVLKHNDRIARNFDRQGNTKLLDILAESIDTDRRDKGGRGSYEGKLIAVDDPAINLAMSPEFRNAPDRRKMDFLMSALRKRPAQARGKYSGPYDKELPTSYDLVPLNNLRGEILNRTPNELRGDLNIIRGNQDNALNLKISPSMLRELSKEYDMSELNSFISDFQRRKRNGI